VLKGTVDPDFVVHGSLATVDRPGAFVRLSDGTCYIRGDFPGQPDAIDLTGLRIHDGFRLGPLTLRRREVTAFWTTPPAQRQALLTRQLARPATLPHIPPRRELDRARTHAESASERLQQVARMTERSLRLSRGSLREVHAIEELLKRTPPPPESLLASREAFLDLIHYDADRYDALYEAIEASNPGITEQLLGLREDQVALMQRYSRGTAYEPRVSSLARSHADFKAAEQTYVEIDRRFKLAATWIDERDRLLDEFRRRADAIVRDAFADVVALPFVEGVEVSVDDEILDIKVKITGRRSLVDPVDFLSEANLDLLALLFLCARAEAAADLGQSQVLVLDDVFQSVDAAYRIRMARFLVERLQSWQLIVLTHDRLWAEELDRIVRAVQGQVLVRRIERWSFQDGPRVSAARFDPSERVTSALEDADATHLSWATGLCLEEICEELSWRLAASVPRQYGDRYTLNTLWEAVASKLKKFGLKTILAPVTYQLGLRNIGSHANVWAKNLSLTEARDFALAVLALLDAVYCKTCANYVKAVTPKLLSCERGCKQLRLQSGGKA